MFYSKSARQLFQLHSLLILEWFYTAEMTVHTCQSKRHSKEVSAVLLQSLRLQCTAIPDCFRIVPIMLLFTTLLIEARTTIFRLPLRAVLQLHLPHL